MGIIFVLLVVCLVALCIKAKMPDTPAERLKFLGEIRGYYFLTLMGAGLVTFWVHPDSLANRHPGWWFLMGIACLLPIRLIDREKKRSKRLYGPNADMTLEELRRETEADKTRRDVLAEYIIQLPHDAANPYDTRFQMTPEQSLDPAVIADWIAAGKPRSALRWSAKYRTRPIP